MTYILGLTGGIASGKSTISQFFKEQSVPVVDADIVARDIVEPGTKGLADIVLHFGTGILLPNGSLNRKKLGRIIFSDEKKRLLLDDILKTPLKKGIDEKINFYRNQNYPLIVFDAPLLFEAGYTHIVDEVMVSYVPREVQIKRLQTRDDIDSIEARKKIASQLSLADKKEMADVVIDNSGTIEQTYKQVEDWLETFKSKLSI